jgi:hypothetical protein
VPKFISVPPPPPSVTGNGGFGVIMMYKNKNKNNNANRTSEITPEINLFLFSSERETIMFTYR